jgi:hypothetical protein
MYEKEDFRGFVRLVEAGLLRLGRVLDIKLWSNFL